MSKLLRFCLAAGSIASFHPAQAQQVSQVLTGESGRAIVEGCRKFSLDAKNSQAIAVFDAGGNMVASLRMDGNVPAVMAFAAEKAKAASMWGFATADMENIVKTFPGFGQAPYVVGLPGGVPIYSADGKTLLGGAGASGEAPAVDVACVEAGIKAAGLASRRAGAPPPPPPAQQQ
jgi:uncharacterized protein GlcG (DUF336 family)